MDRQTVLITGASTGLGLALARRLLDRTDHRLVLTARQGSLPRFAEAGLIGDERVVVRALDVTDHRQRCAVVSEIDERWGGVDVLVNNAGVAYRSVVEHVRDDERLAQMDVNFLAPMELVRLVLPRMRARGAGRIINLSSVGGMMAMPTMAVYSASKFALEGATESLYYEVKPWNIKVSLVQPGFVNSSSFQNVRFTRASLRSRDDELEPYHWHYEYMGPFIARMMRLAFATPERVARKIERVMRQRRPPLRVPATIDARLFSALRRWLPRSVYHWVLYHSLPHRRRWGRVLPALRPTSAVTPPRPRVLPPAARPVAEDAPTAVAAVVAPTDGRER